MTSLVLIALALGLLSASSHVHAQTHTLAFTGMRLIDGSDGRAVDNAVLLVRDGRVVAAGPAGTVSVPDTATRISLAGKVVMPGLVTRRSMTN